jgi:hypothetical protein
LLELIGENRWREESCGVSKNEIFYTRLLNFNQAFPEVGSPVSSEAIKYQAFSAGLGATDGESNLH